MRHPSAAPNERRRLLSLVLPLVVVLVAAGVFVMATRTQAVSPDGTAVTLSDALATYREHPATLRDDIGEPTLPVASSSDLEGFAVPKAGVYTYRTKGQDSIVYEGESYDRPFPRTTYATVHHGNGCVWELYFTPIEEHTDAHRQCSAPGEYLCLAHMQKVLFAGIEADETHHCDPAMIQLGGSASKPGGSEETVCHAHGNKAEIKINFLENETVEVGGVKRLAHHVKIDSFISGDGLDGSAVADVWFDAADGLYLKLVRSADVNVDRGGDNQGTYRIEARYELTSLTPEA